MNQPWQDYIARISQRAGGGATTREQLDALRAHTDASVRQRIAHPVPRLGVRMFPAPRKDKPGRLKTVEARIALDPQQILLASVKETEAEGADVVLRNVRNALITAMVRPLLQDGYADIRIEGNEVVATLTVASPTPKK